MCQAMNRACFTKSERLRALHLEESHVLVAWLPACIPFNDLGHIPRYFLLPLFSIIYNYSSANMVISTRYSEEVDLRNTYVLKQCKLKATTIL